MCNIKALSLLVRKLWPRLKFFKSRSNFKVKAMRSKIMVTQCSRIFLNFQLSTGKWAFQTHFP